MKYRAMMLGIWALCLLAGVVAALWMLLAVVAGSRRAWKIAVGYDQLFNATTGGNEDRTVSSRAAHASKRGKPWGCVLCRVLDWIDPGHCERNLNV